MTVLQILRKKHILVIFLIVSLFSFGIFSLYFLSRGDSTDNVLSAATPKKSSYWFLLQRKSNIEMLYNGVPGDEKQSKLIKTFTVKTGMPGERPTPLPQLLGREYWILVKKEVSENPETAPYFLTLNVPTLDEEPYGPVPYLECNGQCNWVTPGFFGLHGTGDHPEKLSPGDPGSSGCIRHSNADITYLYNLLEPEKEEIRYYMQDV